MDSFAGLSGSAPGSGQLASSSVRARSWLLSLIIPVLLWPTAAAPSPDESPLDLTGMTFVVTRKDRTEFVVEASRARLDPLREEAELEQVHVQVRDARGEIGLELRCDRGTFDLETSDFFASGRVRGRTSDGRHFTSPWIRYEHSSGLAQTDAPVEIVERGGTFRGGGFRYHVREGRLRLLGGASLVQAP